MTHNAVSLNGLHLPYQSQVSAVIWNNENKKIYELKRIIYSSRHTQIKIFYSTSGRVPSTLCSSLGLSINPTSCRSSHKCDEPLCFFTSTLSSSSQTTSMGSSLCCSSTMWWTSYFFSWCDPLLSYCGQTPNLVFLLLLVIFSLWCQSTVLYYLLCCLNHQRQSNTLPVQRQCWSTCRDYLY